MPEFEYLADTERGEPIRGRVNAADEAAAMRELGERGLKVRDLLWCPAVDEGGSLRDDELVTLVHAVGSAAASRVPLEFTLSVLAEEKDDPRLANVARQLAQRMQEGAPLDQAAADLQQELPPEIAGLMQAGLESGDLAGTFERFTQQRLATQRVSRRIRTAIAYPLMVLAMLVPLSLFLSMYVVPMFADLYSDNELALPAITTLILQTAKQVPGLVLGMVALVLLIPIVLRLFGGRWLFHRVRAALPVLGRLWLWSGQREFASLLASFLELRLPLANAIEHTEQIMDDRNVARACRRVGERVRSGDSLSTSLTQSLHFERSLVSVAGWGESHGVLPDALKIATEVYDDRIEQHLALVRRLIPPVALVSVGTILFFVIVGLFIPLIQLLEALSQ